jgi:hypothetical protein
LFCAFPTDPYASIDKKFSNHESLSDLVRSASDGCDLCKVFLHAVLDTERRHSGKGYKNMQEAQDTLLAGEPAKDSFARGEHPELERLGFMSNKEQRKTKRWYAFEVEMRGGRYLVSGTEHENQEHWGYVILKLSWMGKSAEFFVTSDPGKSIP